MESREKKEKTLHTYAVYADLGYGIPRDNNLAWEIGTIKAYSCHDARKRFYEQWKGHHYGDHDIRVSKID